MSDNDIAQDQQAEVSDAQVDATPEAEEKHTGNAEAARWRTKLRETEAELEQARTELAQYKHHELVEAVAAETKVPVDFLQGDTEEEIRASAERLVEFKRAWLPAATSSDVAGVQGEPIGPDPDAATTWAQALTPAWK